MGRDVLDSFNTLFVVPKNNLFMIFKLDGTAETCQVSKTWQVSQKVLLRWLMDDGDLPNSIDKTRFTTLI